MNQIEMLSRQTQSVYDWANKVLRTIPHEQWDNTPAVIDSNITWQAGHLVVSIYFHSVMVITGHQMDVLQKLPLKDYSELFTNAHPVNAKGKTTPSALYEHLLYMEKRSIEVIQSLSLQDLESALAPSPIPHPVAKTKLEALEWNINHTMWHYGQIGMIKRVIDERFDFGLKM
jgi:hypothetical protein